MSTEMKEGASDWRSLIVSTTKIRIVLFIDHQVTGSSSLSIDYDSYVKFTALAL